MALRRRSVKVGPACPSGGAMRMSDEGPSRQIVATRTLY
jgi:hypothetical protein